MNSQELIKKAVERKDCYILCKYFFKTELSPKQEEIVRAIVFKESKRIVISCLTRYGKSWAVSQAILLFIYLNDNKRVLIIAPREIQTTIIRNYLSTFSLESEEMMNLIDAGAKGIERLRSEVSRKRITFKNGCEIMNLSAEGDGERLMGFGGDLIIKDEDCLINYQVYQDKISRMLGDNPDSMMVSIGNPWNRNNQMWDHWCDKTFKKIHVGYKDALKEGRITESFVEEQKRTLNPISFKVLYEAEFPETAEDSLINYTHIKESLYKEFKMEEPTDILGVDVARFGMDSTVLTHVQEENGKYKLIKQYVYNKLDTMQTVGNIRKLHSKIGFQTINVDVIGVGSGVLDRLKEEKLPAEPAHFGQSPTKPFEANRKRTSQVARQEDQTRTILHSNKKAEQYFRLAQLFEEGKISIKDCDMKLVDNLRKMGFEITSGGKTKIIDPEDGKSPDYADSLVYACWQEENEVIIDF